MYLFQIIFIQIIVIVLYILLSVPSDLQLNARTLISSLMFVCFFVGDKLYC